MTDTSNAPLQSPAAARSPLWMRITLAVSLALNLLVVGVIAGAFIAGLDKRTSRPSGGTPEVRMMREMGFGPFLNAFNADQNRELGRLIRQEVGSLAMNRDALRQELATMVSTLRSTPYDHAAFSAVMERQRQRMNARTEAALSVVLKAIGEASDADRIAFADRLERSLRRAMERAASRDRDRGGDRNGDRNGDRGN